MNVLHAKRLYCNLVSTASQYLFGFVVFKSSHSLPCSALLVVVVFVVIVDLEVVTVCVFIVLTGGGVGEACVEMSTPESEKHVIPREVKGGQCEWVSVKYPD